MPAGPLRLTAGSSSSSWMVPVPAPVLTPAGASDTVSPTVKVSSLSTTSSSTADTARLCCSPAAPLKVSAPPPL